MSFVTEPQQTPQQWTLLKESVLFSLVNKVDKCIQTLSQRNPSLPCIRESTYLQVRQTLITLFESNENYIELKCIHHLFALFDQGAISEERLLNLIT